MALEQLKDWARRIKREATALWFAAKDPATPWPARVLVGLIVLYALSPIDLIPDFIPVLGLLDELILLPAAIWLAVRLIPANVMARAREHAAQLPNKPQLNAGVALIAAIWLLALGGLGWWWWRTSR